MAPTLEEPKPKTHGRGRPRGSSRSEEARGNSSRNAMHAGLFARTWALPHEPQAWARRADDWHNHYNPQSPAACHLANECARATVQADRADAFERATLEAQGRQCRQNWNRRRRRRVTELTRKLNTDPRGAAAELKSFAFGLVWIIGVYREMIEAARERGYLLPDELGAVIRIWGIAPEDQVIRRYEIPYLIQVYNLGATPGVAPAVLDEWLTTANRLVELRKQAREEVLPETPEDCTTLLVAVLEGQIDAYSAQEERLRTKVDAPDLQECLDRAGVLNDTDGRRVGRSKAEAKSAYHRAHKALVETLKRDAEEAEEEGDEDEEPQSDAPAAAGAAAASEATPGSQNENPAKVGSSSQMAGETTSSSDGPASKETRPFGDQKPSEGGAKPGAMAATGDVWGTTPAEAGSTPGTPSVVPNREGISGLFPAGAEPVPGAAHAAETPIGEAGGPVATAAVAGFQNEIPSTTGSSPQMAA